MSFLINTTNSTMPMQNFTLKSSNYIRYFILFFYFPTIFSAFAYSVCKSGQIYDQMQPLFNVVNEMFGFFGKRIEVNYGIKNKLSTVLITPINGWNYTGTSLVSQTSKGCNISAINSVNTSHRIVLEIKDYASCIVNSCENSINMTLGAQLNASIASRLKIFCSTISDLIVDIDKDIKWFVMLVSVVIQCATTFLA